MYEAFELWGYPGAGKTTVARALQRDYRISLRRLKNLGDIFDTNPILTRWIYARHGLLVGRERWPVHNTDPRTKNNSRTAILSMAARQAVTLLDFRQPAFLEEGLVHEIWRQLYIQPALIPERWWRRILRRNQATVIVLDVSPERAQQGIQKKAKPGTINSQLRITQLSGPEWARATAAYQAIKEELVLDASRRTVRVQNETTDVQETSRIISEVIQGRLTR